VKKTATRLIAILGHDGFDALVREFGDKLLRVPASNPIDRDAALADRNRRVTEALRTKSHRTVAREMGLSPSPLTHISKRTV